MLAIHHFSRVFDINVVELTLGRSSDRGAHTRRKGLLKLLGLVVVLQHQGVEVLLASDLELDVVGLLVLLDPRGWRESKLVNEIPLFSILSLQSRISSKCFPPPGRPLGWLHRKYVHEASLRRQISMNWGEEERQCIDLKKSNHIFLNEIPYLLDISDLLRHFGGI